MESGVIVLPVVAEETEIVIVLALVAMEMDVKEDLLKQRYHWLQKLLDACTTPCVLTWIPSE